MAVIDVEALLVEVSAEAPSGPDLEYEPAFGELERVAQGRPEQQIGEKVLPAEEPDWRALKRGALDLLARTKDLRIAVHLTRALLHTDGLTGLSEGLGLIQGLIECYWESVHPQLDPEEDNDPTMRVNSLVPLSDAEGLLWEIRTATVVSSHTLGHYSLRDLMLASGKLTAKDGEVPPESAAIEAAFQESDPEVVQATAEAVKRARGSTQAIESRITDKVGTVQGLNLRPLSDLLKELEQLLSLHLERIGVRMQTGGQEGAEATETGSATMAGARSLPEGGEITSREEVVHLLDKVCEYYERHEPSSPVPLLLQRAKRLVHKDFIEIVRDLTPEGLPQAEMLRGSDREGSSR